MAREHIANCLDSYLYLTEAPLNILSVFDELRYDRSDVDMLSPGMRKHVAKRLARAGFKQSSGRLLTHNEIRARCHLPKPTVLGASPFHTMDHISSYEYDFFVLTPTQTAGAFVDHYDLAEAVERICALVEKQPINLFKLKDYLEGNSKHQDFLQAVPHIKYRQRKAVESEPLKQKRALK